MTHNMKAFLELTGENKKLAARVQMLLVGDNGRLSAVTQAAIIRLAAEHGLELHTADLDHMSPDLSGRPSASEATCHCFMGGNGNAVYGANCQCVMYGSGYSGSNQRRRDCSCTTAGIGM